MSVKIGHASLDENKKIAGGVAGDQTGGEVTTRTWYNKPWEYVIRAKDGVVAEKIAVAMEQACANNNIGYDQRQRTTLYAMAKNENWNLSKIKTACECDCSSLVAVCVNAAGVAVSKDIYTGNQREALVSTGKFDVYTGSKYIHSQDCLKRGDILLSSGHTAVVLSNGANACDADKKVQSVKKASEAAKSGPLKALAGTYQVTASALNVRNGAGTSKTIMATISKGTLVNNYGFYTDVSGTRWMYIQFDYCGVTYIGFASGKYLKKV
jgi:hypothetical protein